MKAFRHKASEDLIRLEEEEAYALMHPEETEELMKGMIRYSGPASYIRGKIITYTTSAGEFDLFSFRERYEPIGLGKMTDLLYGI